MRSVVWLLLLMGQYVRLMLCYGFMVLQEYGCYKGEKCMSRCSKKGALIAREVFGPLC